MDPLVSILAILAFLLLAGLVLGLADRPNFRFGWLVVAIALVATEDALLTSAYGLLPGLLPGSWNWQGKGLALVALLAVAAHPSFGFDRVGLTLRQRPGSLMACLPVAGLYLGLFVAIALLSPNEAVSAEDLAFQLTMPGLEEEIFYRGLLLLALNEAFRGRWRALGIDWGWGALLTSILFGLTHAFSFADGTFAFDPLYFALTAIPSLLAVWLRERSGSLLLPILIHNAGNSLPMLL